MRAPKAVPATARAWIGPQNQAAAAKTTRAIASTNLRTGLRRGPSRVVEAIGLAVAIRTWLAHGRARHADAPPAPYPAAPRAASPDGLREWGQRSAAADADRAGGGRRASWRAARAAGARDRRPLLRRRGR